jgi:hypothetical protein
MNYFDALKRVLTKEDREEIKKNLSKRNMEYSDITIYNVVKGETKYSPEILKAVHEIAKQRLFEIQQALSEIESPTASGD